jgi:hypothetical protein
MAHRHAPQTASNATLHVVRVGAPQMTVDMASHVALLRIDMYFSTGERGNE